MCSARVQGPRPAVWSVAVKEIKGCWAAVGVYEPFLNAIGYICFSVELALPALELKSPEAKL